MKMTAEKKKNKAGHEVKLLANREANNQFKAQQNKRKSISNTEEGNLFHQITISNGEEAKNLSRCQQKKKSVPPDQKVSEKGVVVAEPSNNNNNTEQMDVDEPMATYFQEEILMDILNRLPVRSLLRFKCVSKFWKTLISDPYFKMTHLNHAKNYQSSQKFVISQCCPKDGIYSMYCFPLSLVQPVENVQKHDFPLVSKPYRCAIRCCCDGLVIVIVNDNIDIGRNIHLLWNPSMGESIVLPDLEPSPNDSTHLGFGYDSTSGDYKILKIHTNIDSPGEILTLKSGSRRNIDKHPRGICNMMEGMHSLPFVNESFHWIGIFRKYSVASRKYSVVSFSISNEVYGEIPLPEQILCLTGNISIGVSVLDGMLCAHSTCIYQRRDCFKLWVLKDYGVEESWNALFFISDDHGFYSAIPNYRFEDGEVLFWCMRVHCRGQSFRTSKGPFGLWPRCDTCQSGISFTESLISPKSLI
ncbi:hypothetical protein HAX54_023057 [Datura stramonium]|uniref:F-box domain-containing protein n=1 Tax=Datura stramonium TaxID=4076 RepID=A0ABS8UVP2_DATST|nr:hypothetical protein [Datura stramonium]